MPGHKVLVHPRGDNSHEIVPGAERHEVGRNSLGGSEPAADNHAHQKGGFRPHLRHDQIRNFTAKVVECSSEILACVMCRISCLQCRISRFQGGMKGETGIMMGGLPLLAEQSPCRPLQAARH